MFGYLFDIEPCLEFGLLILLDNGYIQCCFYQVNLGPPGTLHRGSSSTCWVLVRDLDIDLHFFGVIGFLWMKSNSYDGP